MKYYNEFVKGKWNNAIDVENFIELNYKEYLGDEKFLCKSNPKVKAHKYKQKHTKQTSFSPLCFMNSKTVKFQKQTPIFCQQNKNVQHLQTKQVLIF